MPVTGHTVEVNRHQLADGLREQTQCLVCGKVLWQKSGEVIFEACQGPSAPAAIAGFRVGDPVVVTVAYGSHAWACAEYDRGTLVATGKDGSVHSNPHYALHAAGGEWRLWRDPPQDITAKAGTWAWALVQASLGRNVYHGDSCVPWTLEQLASRDCLRLPETWSVR